MGGSKMTPKNRTLEGKNRTLGGVKNRRKLSDIIYARSLSTLQMPQVPLARSQRLNSFPVLFDLTI
jgi:hypothetical protein